MTHRNSRRDFLKFAAAAAAAGAINNQAQEAEARRARPVYDGEIVDTHLHLWDLSELKLPWVDGLTGNAKTILGKDYKLADYAEATKGLNVTKAVYMEVDVAETHQVKEAEFVSKVCESGASPMKAAVISGRPASDGFKDYMDRFKGNPHIKGLRQLLRGTTLYTDPKFIKGLQLLGERKLSFDLCIKGSELAQAAELVDKCPETRFVLDHCGDPFKGGLEKAVWEKGLAAVAGAKNRNVLCKISGVYADVTPADYPPAKLAPYIRSVITTFGWDRVIFAGDWPVVNLGATFRQWLETVKAVVSGDAVAEQKKLFHDNAVAFYGLK